MVEVQIENLDVHYKAQNKKQISNYFTKQDFDEINRFLKLFEIARNGTPLTVPLVNKNAIGNTVQMPEEATSEKNESSRNELEKDKSVCSTNECAEI